MWCNEAAGTGCPCGQTVCRCACSIPVAQYAGEIILIPAGHDRLDSLIASRLIVPDAALPSADELLEDPEHVAHIEERGVPA